MLVPVRCFTCGNLIADKFEDYQNRIKSGEEPAKILSSLGMERYCCRRMLLTSVETIQQVVETKNSNSDLIKEKVISDVTSDLTETEIEKFQTLAPVRLIMETLKPMFQVMMWS